MCGICGKLYFNRERQVEQIVLADMCLALRHRGPDDMGFYIKGPIGLGSRRLSIIDLEGGHMPLSNEDGSVWIAYNGEVYNFQELRDRLERAGHFFRTRSDTETIVHLYEEEGDEFVRHLNGMFAIALWDDRKKRLVLARDPLGIKPLFYTQLPDRLLFGSEIKALLNDGIERQIDRLALHDYLSLNYVPGPRTILKNVFKLQPGHILTSSLNDRRVQVRPYWEFPRPDDTSGIRRSTADLENELLSLLRKVVRDTLVSDVPVGAFLSGGLDSSLIVALMSEVAGQDVRTFSVGFKERSYNELPYAKLAADRFQTIHHELVLEPRAEETVHAMAEFFDEPFADNSALAVYAVSQLAAQNVKVVLSGDGGDEIFGGYNTYQADRLASVYRLLPAFVGAGMLPNLVHHLPTSFEKASIDFRLKRFVSGAAMPPLAAHYSWKAYLNEEMKMRLYNLNALNGDLKGLRPTLDLFQECYDGYSVPDELNRLIYVDNKIQLADDMLAKVDRMSMAHSLEVRVPFLDLRLVKFMASLPSQYKVRGFKLKYLAKRVATRLLPMKILNRNKGGFSIPLAHWVGADLRKMIENYLSPSTLKNQGIFDPHTVKGMLDAHWEKKQDFGRSIWTLLMFSLWCERYLNADRRTPTPCSEDAPMRTVSCTS